MEDDVLIFLGIICSKCNNVLDVLNNKEDFLYINKACECGSIGFYTVKMKIKIIIERPYDKEPFFEQDGHEFFKGHE